MPPEHKDVDLSDYLKSSKTNPPPSSVPENPQKAHPPMIRFVISMELAKDSTQASYILLGLAVLSIIASIYFFFFVGRESNPPVPRQTVERALQNTLIENAPR